MNHFNQAMVLLVLAGVIGWAFALAIKRFIDLLAFTKD